MAENFVNYSDNLVKNFPIINSWNQLKIVENSLNSLK